MIFQAQFSILSSVCFGLFKFCTILRVRKFITSTESSTMEDLALMTVDCNTFLIVYHLVVLSESFGDKYGYYTLFSYSKTQKPIYKKIK